MRNHVTTLLLISVAACSKGESKPTQDPKGSAAPAPTSVAIFVDDKPVGRLDVEQIKLYPRVDTLVPVSARRLGTWQTVTLRAHATRSAAGGR